MFNDCLEWLILLFWCYFIVNIIIIVFFGVIFKFDRLCNLFFFFCVILFNVDKLFKKECVLFNYNYSVFKFVFMEKGKKMCICEVVVLWFLLFVMDNFDYVDC